MPVNTVCILGGTGFVGSHLVAKLSSQCHRIVVLTSNREKNKQLLVLPNLQLIEANIHDKAELKKHFNGVDAVINLIGILNEGVPRGQTFQKAHVELARTVVEVCIASGVSRLLHMSALHANAATGTSKYLRSKGEAENYLFSFAAKHMQVSSFRPSVIFGPGDSFFNRFADLLKALPVFPLACPGARFAPVYVGDVVNTICDDLLDSSPGNRRYDLCGPDEYTLRQLVEYTYKTLGLKRLIINLPAFAARMQARVMAHMPGKPFTYDNYLSLQTDSVCGDDHVPQPTTVDSVVPTYLVHSFKQEHLQRLRELARRGGV